MTWHDDRLLKDFPAFSFRVPMFKPRPFSTSLPNDRACSKMANGNSEVDRCSPALRLLKRTIPGREEGGRDHPRTKCTHKEYPSRAQRSTCQRILHEMCGVSGSSTSFGSREECLASRHHLHHRREHSPPIQLSVLYSFV